MLTNPIRSQKKVKYTKKQAEKMKAAEKGAKESGGWDAAIENLKSFVSSDEKEDKKYKKLRKSMKRD